MAISLRWRVLLPLLTTLLLGMGLLAMEHMQRVRQAHRVTLVHAFNDAMANGLLRVLELHDRSMQRAQDGVLESDQDKRLAMLKWTAEHYLDDSASRMMGLAELLQQFGRSETLRAHGIDVPTPSVMAWPMRSRHDGFVRIWQTDLDRLLPAVQDLRAQAQKVANALDGVLEVVQPGSTPTLIGALANAQHENGDERSTPEADPELLANTARDLYRADRDFQHGVRVIETTLQRIVSRHMQLALHAQSPLPVAWWWVFAAWAIVAVVIAYLPLARLHRIVAGDRALSTSVFASPEERSVIASAQKNLSAHDDLAARLDERSRDTDRALANARRAEHDLALLKLYNAHLVNSLRSAIVVTDATGHITSANRTARTLLGIGNNHVAEPIQDHPLYKALASRLPEGWQHIERAKESIKPLRFDSVPCAPYTSETLPATKEWLLDVAIVPYQDESGRARGLLWVVDDVTDAVHTKSQLLAAERLAAIGRLSSQVAHEIRNPLSAIGLNAELLEDEFSGGLGEPHRSEAIQLLRAIAQEIERLTDITEGYLQLARAPRPQCCATDFNQVVTDLVSMLAPEMKLHAIQMQLQLATPAPVGWADPGQIRQALLNIVRNSREAMPQGGHITIRTFAPAHSTTACIAVHDTGPGIPPELRARVFEPFFTTKPEGTGLGLSLTQQMIAEHGGSIQLDGEQASPGACIIICIPQTAAGSRLQAI